MKTADLIPVTTGDAPGFSQDAVYPAVFTADGQFVDVCNEQCRWIRMRRSAVRFDLTAWRSETIASGNVKQLQAAFAKLGDRIEETKAARHREAMVAALNLAKKAAGLKE